MKIITPTDLKPLRSNFTLVLLSFILLPALLASTYAFADVLGDRKSNFKANADAMKAIAAAIGSGDRETVIQKANVIAAWAQKIPAHFPEGSDAGDTKARPEIWFEFDTFVSRAKANEDAALTLIKAAEIGDPSAMISGLKNLGASCKACHSSFKD